MKGVQKVMNTQRKHTEKGFTLVEMTMSIVASGILMLTVMNLMGLSAQKWEEGNAVRSMAMEMAMTLNTMAEDVQGSTVDSITVTATNDTLRIGSDVMYRYTDSNDLIIERNGNSFTFMEDMLTSFSVDTPVVGVEGDTLDMVSVMMVVEQEGQKDSTTIWLTPRL